MNESKSFHRKRKLHSTIPNAMNMFVSTFFIMGYFENLAVGESKYRGDYKNEDEWVYMV